MAGLKKLFFLVDPVEVRFQLLMVFLGVVMVLLVIQMIRAGKFHVAYSALWLGISVAFLLVSLSSNLVQFLANLFQVEYPPSLMYAIGIVFIFLMLINHAVIYTQLSREIHQLAQDNALLKWRMEQWEEMQGKNPLAKTIAPDRKLRNDQAVPQAGGSFVNE